MNMQKLIGRPFRQFLCVLLAAALATGPTAQTQGQGPVQREVDSDLGGLGGTTLLAAPEAGKIDVRYVSPGAVAVALLRPRQLMTSPATALLPVEVASAAGLLHFGIDPAEVDEITAFAEPPLGVTLPYGVVIKFSQPFDVDRIPEKLRAHTQPAELAGKSYLASQRPQLPSLYMADDRTLLAMPEATLKQVLAPTAKPAGALVEHAGALPGGHDLYAVVDIAALRPMIVPWLGVAAIRQGDAFPEEAKPLLEVPNLISAADLAINITNSSPTLLALHANDAKSADRLEELYSLAKQIQQKRALEGAAQLQQSNDPIRQAFGKYIERVTKANVEVHHWERRGDNLILLKVESGDHSAQTQLVLAAVGGIVVALLLPAIQAAREAARRTQSLNNLKQLMLSLHVYADAKKTFPAHASYSADGKPLLSWRVHVLPYLDQQALYQQFHLDEPWDSPHNRTLIAQMPAVFANPALGGAEGKTNYLAIVGKDCVFDGTAQGIGFRDITDGTSKTIMLVEANPDQAVEWTKPDDLEFDPDNPRAGLGALRPDWFNVAWADGRASFVANGIDPQILKAMATRGGGEAIDPQ